VSHILQSASEPVANYGLTLPNLGTTLTLSGARKLDMAKLQSLAKRSQCPFVEFRAAADDSQMNQEAQQVNSRAVVQFAAKLASGQLVSSAPVRL